MSSTEQDRERLRRKIDAELSAGPAFGWNRDDGDDVPDLSPTEWQRKQDEQIGAVAAAEKSPVVCWETGQVYPDVTDASHAVCVFPGEIIRAIATRQRAGGFHWHKPGVDFKPWKRPTYQVVCHETKVTYDSIRAAATALGVWPSAIYTAIESGRPCKGFHWYRTDKPPAQMQGRAYGRAVERTIDGKRFESASDAARELHTKPWRIFRAIRSQIPEAGSYWKYVA